MSFTAEEQAFQAEVRSFLADNLPTRISDAVKSGKRLKKSDYEEWHALLNSRGWLAVTWPEELGGTGWGAVERFIFEEECCAAGAPRIVPFGLNMFMKLSDLRDQWVNLIRSSLIGTWIGILPGIGGTTGAIASYSVARTFSRRSKEFGTGCEDGIVAAETANNAAVNGALVPLITMILSSMSGPLGSSSPVKRPHP